MPIYKKKIVNLIQDISKCVRKNAGKIRDKRKTIIRKKNKFISKKLQIYEKTYEKYSKLIRKEIFLIVQEQYYFTFLVLERNGYIVIHIK